MAHTRCSVVDKKRILDLFIKDSEIAIYLVRHDCLL